MLLPKGFHLLAKRPKLFWRGAIPPLISSIVYIAVLVLVISNAMGIAQVLTPWASNWQAAEAFRVFVAIALVGGLALIMVLTFSALTLAIGAPIYDSISEHLERDLGGLPDAPHDPVAAMVWRAVRQGVILVGLGIVVALLVFAIGLIPVVGTVVAWVLSASLGGWLLSLDLVGSTFERRGLMSLGDRQQVLRGRRWRTLGFAIPSFVLVSIPLVAIVVFPVAKAGATLLARDALSSSERSSTRKQRGPGLTRGGTSDASSPDGRATGTAH